MTKRHPMMEDREDAQGLPVMLWRAGPGLACEEVNRAWLAFTGLDEAEALGDGWSRSIHPEDLPRWLETCLHAFDSREPFELEYRMRRYDGEYRWVMERGVPCYAEKGRFCGFIGVCAEVGDRRRAELEIARALEDARAPRGERAGAPLPGEASAPGGADFLARVLADLRLPVHTLAEWAARLRAGVSEASDAARALDVIEHNARAQERIIATLLELAGTTSEPSRQAAAQARPQEPQPGL